MAFGSNVKAQIKTPEPKAMTAATARWLIFRLVPMRDPRIKEKPVRAPKATTVARVNTAANIGPRNGEVKQGTLPLP